MVNEFPMTAGLVAQNMRTSFCGATIIDKSYAITAAHCLTNRKVNTLALLVGDHDYQSGNNLFVQVKILFSCIKSLFMKNSRLKKSL